jgi:hypothetical protein
VPTSIKGGDLPGLKALMKQMDAANMSVLVGIPVGASRKFKASKVNVTQEDAGLTLAMIAAVHEFGSPEHNIPERPFLREGIHRAIPKLNAVNVDSLRRVLLGKMTIEQAVDKLGAVAAGEVKRGFVEIEFMPLTADTVNRKGSTRPLIDTGSLRQSISYIVEGAKSAYARHI